MPRYLQHHLERISLKNKPFVPLIQQCPLSISYPAISELLTVFILRPVATCWIGSDIFSRWNSRSVFDSETRLQGHCELNKCLYKRSGKKFLLSS